MAKFLLMGEKAFVQMIRRINKGSFQEGDREVRIWKNLARNFSEKRDKLKEAYEKTTGKPVPAGKVVVPKDVYGKMEEFLRDKRGVERRAASMRDLDRAFYKKKLSPGGSKFPAMLGEKGAFTFQSGPPGMPVRSSSPRKPKKAEIREFERKFKDYESRVYELAELSGGKNLPVLRSVEESDLLGDLGVPVEQLIERLA